MKKFLIIGLTTASLCLLIVCVGCASRSECDGIDIIHYGPGETELRFCKRSWRGILGPHGYVGYETTGYGAILLGNGHTFINPIFVDNPGYFHCVGTITLDEEHNRVTINMRRIVSELGKPERTKLHPANGTYTISKVREAYPDEREGFKDWVARELNINQK